MANLVTVAYAITPSGPSAAALVATMQNPLVLGGPGVPIPDDVLQFLGLWVVSDGMAGTTRTVVMSFSPSVAATIGVTLSNTATVKALTVTPGKRYIQPPIVQFAGPAAAGKPLVQPSARAYLNVQDFAVPYPGAAYPGTTTVAFIGGLPPALFLNPQDSKYAADKTGYPAPNGPPYAVNSISLVKIGRGYSASAYVEFQGGEIVAGGHPAQAVISSLGPNGEILEILLIDPGQGYSVPPNIAIIDPLGSPAQAGTAARAVANMGAGTPATATLTFGLGGTITGLAGITPGDGYVQPPTLVIYDSTGAGSGAQVLALMGVGRVDVVNPGQGVPAGTTATLVPAFKSMFPDTSDQRTPFNDFALLFLIKQATASQVIPSVPVLT